MSAIDGSRKLLQDFLAPELRAISVRLDALEKRFDEAAKRQEKFSDSVDKRFDAVEKQAEKRHDQVLTAINRLAEINEMRDRLTRLETKEAAHQ
jgi:hypothetical protein